MDVLDLCSGLGGATKAFADRGHNVTSVDIEPGFKPNIIADVRTLEKIDFPGEYHFIWASPPCTEFTKWSMPWYRSQNLDTPDMSIIEHCIHLVNELKPTYWIIENIRGSKPYIEPLLGNHKKRISYHYIWGKFPLFYVKKLPKRKSVISGECPEIRSLIPYELSLALCIAIENTVGE